MLAPLAPVPSAYHAQDDVGWLKTVDEYYSAGSSIGNTRAHAVQRA